MDNIIDICSYPVKNVLSLLLEDKTTGHNIIFATDAVLISSWKYREEMKEDVESELETINLKDVEIIEFYSELQQKGIPIDSEYFWFDWDFDV